MSLKFLFFSLLLIVLLAKILVPEQENRQFFTKYQSGQKIRITEKTNLRRYTNLRFDGLLSKEVSGVVTVNQTPISFLVEGEFLVFEALRRDRSIISKRINETVYSKFRIFPNGEYQSINRVRYPSMQSFPVYPNHELQPGDEWEAFGTQIVEPFSDGIMTQINFISQFKYKEVKTID